MKPDFQGPLQSQPMTTSHKSSSLFALKKNSEQPSEPNQMMNCELQRSRTPSGGKTRGHHRSY